MATRRIKIAGLGPFAYDDATSKAIERDGVEAVFGDDLLNIEGANIETLTTDKTLDTSDKQIQSLTPSGASRSVILPLASSSAGKVYYFHHNGTSYALYVKDGTTVKLWLQAGMSGVMFSDGSSWYGGIIGKSGAFVSGSLASNYVMQSYYHPVQVLKFTFSTYNVHLPPVNEVKGRVFYIYNAGTSLFGIKDNSGSTTYISSLASGDLAVCISTGSDWIIWTLTPAYP